MNTSNDTPPDSSGLDGQDTLSQLLREPSHTYIETEKKMEDVRSSAWVCSITGSLGLLALLALWLGIIPLPISLGTKYMSSVVLGGLFIFFLVIGIKSFGEMKSLKLARAFEDALSPKIVTWFSEHYSSDALSSGMDESDISIEELYYLRSENISRVMSDEFGSMSQDYMDYMIEKIYQMYFPD